MTLFRLPDGERITLRLRYVGVEASGDCVKVDRATYTDATATGCFEVVGGVPRRLFADCEPAPADYSTDLWMEDGDVYNYAAGTGTFATASR